MSEEKNVEKKKSNGGKKVYKIDIRTMPQRKSFRIPTIILIIGFTILLSVGSYFLKNLTGKGDEVAVSKIVTDISEKKYDKIHLKNDQIVLIKEESKDGAKIQKKKYALLPENTNFFDILSNAGIKVQDLENDFYKPNVNITFGDIVTFLFLGVAVVFGYVMLKNLQSSSGKIMDFGESKARLLFGKKTGMTFDSVAGIDEVKEELTEIVDFLKNPKKYVEAGARIPKGVLLAGAPGTGKTLLAKAIAGEAGVPFFHTSGSEFEEMLVGAGASRVRDLFKKARKASPCIDYEIGRASCRERV